MRSFLISIFLIALLLFLAPNSWAGENKLVSDRSDGRSFALVSGGKAAPIYFDPADHRVVGIAAEALAGDIEMVAGVKPILVNSAADAGRSAVIIGSLDRSALISEMISKGRLDATSIVGKWESFIITTVESPLPGLSRALVIVGSDRRGAAFGAFELSEQIGVSPWVWWADSRPARRSELHVRAGSFQLGPPSVKYRGIFINDEDFGMQPWSAKTFEPEIGDIGPKSYAKVFELLLRLKANHIWPAMHKCTHAFNYYDDNKRVADDYAIVMGSSHCEQMLRNNVDEWKRDGKGSWNYQVNRKNVLKYWEDRVRENGQYENIYTIGMRALHDSPIHAVGTRQTILDLHKKLFADQRGLLEEWVNPDVTQVPQVLCLYNEVLDYYRDGMEVPDDVTILWVDDNHGYIRKLSNDEERTRSGGSGVYYHVSYWGTPHDYLWLCSTPPGLIYEEMYKAYEFNARRVWMLNVGDIKPAEAMTEFFLQMGWNIDRWQGADPGGDFLRWFAQREFGSELAEEITDIMVKYYTLNFQRKPEHMGFSRLAHSMIPAEDPEFSLFHYGDEAERRLNDYQRLDERAEQIYNKLPQEKRDAFYQLVSYPVRGSYLMNRKILYAYKSRVYAKQGRTSANRHAEIAAESFEGIKEETRRYNEEISDGKWEHMMSWQHKRYPVFGMPKTGKVLLIDRASMGVAVEGHASPIGSQGALPEFNRLTPRERFIDIFNKGAKPFDWEAEPSDEWIKLSKSEGEVEDEERIWISIDFADAPGDDRLEGEVVITGAGSTKVVKVSVLSPDEDIPPGSFVQDNGVISINAESFNKKERGANGASWESVGLLGRDGAAMMLQPFTVDPLLDPEDVESRSPMMEYSLYVHEPGEARIIIHTLPTLPIHEEYKLVLGVSLDDETPTIVEFEHGGAVLGFNWDPTVLYACVPAGLTMSFDQGQHSLKLWGADPSLVVDKIMIDFGGLKESYLGPEETRIKNQ